MILQTWVFFEIDIDTIRSYATLQQIDSISHYINRHEKHKNGPYDFNADMRNHYQVGKQFRISFHIQG